MATTETRSCDGCAAEDECERFDVDMGQGATDDPPPLWLCFICRELPGTMLMDGSGRIVAWTVRLMAKAMS